MAEHPDGIGSDGNEMVSVWYGSLSASLRKILSFLRVLGALRSLPKCKIAPTIVTSGSGSVNTIGFRQGGQKDLLD